jgi:dihydroorotase
MVTSIKASPKTGPKSSLITIDGIDQPSPAHEICVSPGWVDLFADYCEPGYEHKETIASGLAAAAAGGYTAVLSLPNTKPAVASKSVVQYILQSAAGNIVDLQPMGAATQNIEGKDLAEMMDMRHNGAIAFTDGWKPIQSANLMLKALEYVKAFEGTIVQMPVDASLAAGGLMSEGEVSTRLGMAGIPQLAETLMLYRDIELLRYTGSKLHITGITTAPSVDLVRQAKAQGLNSTCSVTPYHLALTDEALQNYDSQYKLTPPLRTETDRQALIEAVVDGTVDCIAAHHRPHEWDAKTREFEYAADGMAAQELAFNITWQAIGQRVERERLVQLFSTAPCNIFGLSATHIGKGCKAAFTLFCFDGETTLTIGNKKSNGMNNPFLGKPLAGKVIGIINNKQIKLNQ